MNNIVIKKFISNKIERNIDKNSLIGDIVNQFDLCLQIASTNKNIKPNTAEYMLSETNKMRKDFEKLYKNKKFIHLNAYSVYKLMKLKEKLSNTEVFEI